MEDTITTCKVDADGERMLRTGTASKKDITRYAINLIRAKTHTVAQIALFTECASRDKLQLGLDDACNLTVVNTPPGSDEVEIHNNESLALARSNWFADRLVEEAYD